MFKLGNMSTVCVAFTSTWGEFNFVEYTGFELKQLGDVQGTPN